MQNNHSRSLSSSPKIQEESSKQKKNIISHLTSDTIKQQKFESDVEIYNIIHGKVERIKNIYSENGNENVCEENIVCERCSFHFQLDDNL